LQLARLARSWQPDAYHSTSMIIKILISMIIVTSIIRRTVRTFINLAELVAIALKLLNAH